MGSDGSGGAKESLTGEEGGRITDGFGRAGWESGRERVRDCRELGDENGDSGKQPKRQRMLEGNAIGVSSSILISDKTIVSVVKIRACKIYDHCEHNCF